MPWMTAFSTSGCSSSGGTGQSAACGSVSRAIVQARSEPHLLDGEEPLGERPLIGKRNAAARPEAERVAQKIGEQQAHRPRGGGVGRGQRADRMQAVEDEVRIDLRAQRAQLGFAREQRLLERAASPRRATL